MHGVKRLFAWMIPRFDRTRFNVSLVSLRKKDLSEETLESLGVEIEYLHRSKFDPATLPALLKVIDRRQMDILHLHGYGATTFGRMAGAMRRLPTILHEHANLTDTPWFQKVADRALEPFTDIALAVSRSTADSCATRGSCGPTRFASSTSALRWRSSGRHALQRRWPRHGPNSASALSEFAIGTITRLHDSKGNEYLVEAARQVVGRHPNARFFLAGEGPLRPALEAQAAALGLGDRFVFAGFVKDVAATLSAFDLSVFPSLWEGTPLTAFEALAAGKPIVATDADGLLDILDADRTAWIVPKRDAAALAERIVHAIEHPDERAAMGARAREAGRSFDINAFVQKMERLYPMLHQLSRPTHRRGILEQDLSFLGQRVPA